MRLTFGRIVLLVGLLLLPILWGPAREFVAVDACLDRGGSFDYARGRCDVAANHAHPPVLSRWRTWVTGQTVARSLLLVTVGALTLRTRDRRRPFRAVA